MMLAFIGSFAVAFGLAYVVFLAVLLRGLTKVGLEGIPGALTAALAAGVVTFAVVLWVLAQ